MSESTSISRLLFIGINYKYSFYKKKVILFCTDEIPVIKLLKLPVKRYE